MFGVVSNLRSKKNISTVAIYLSSPSGPESQSWTIANTYIFTIPKALSPCPPSQTDSAIDEPFKGSGPLWYGMQGTQNASWRLRQVIFTALL